MPPALPTLREPPICNIFGKRILQKLGGSKVRDSFRRREMKIYICYKYSINIDQR